MCGADLLAHGKLPPLLPGAAPRAGRARYDALRSPQGLKFVQAVEVLNVLASQGSTRITAVVGISLRRVFRLFEVFSPYTPRDYLRFMRVYRAAEFLCHAGATIDEAWKQAGFRAHSTFEREFHAITRLTPTAFRNSHRFDSTSSKYLGPYFERENVRYLTSPDFARPEAMILHDESPQEHHGRMVREGKDFFARELISYRRRMQLTQQKLAEQLGIGTNYLRDLERRRRRPSLQKFEHMCDAIGIERKTQHIVRSMLWPPDPVEGRE
jgi:AraC-like DNA-binding protein/DNA-binding transcriptional regulator YiaG